MTIANIDTLLRAAAPQGPVDPRQRRATSESVSCP